jgi:hypothetical protein
LADPFAERQGERRTHDLTELRPDRQSATAAPEPTLKPRRHERHETNGCRRQQVRFTPFS